MTAEQSHTTPSPRRGGQPSERRPSETLIPLRRALWLDLEAGVILRGRSEILLTARELQVLKALARAMRLGRGYLTAGALASALVSEEVSDPVHAIQETVSSIRKKLGERPFKPTILRCRRQLGYRLFPDVSVSQ